MHLSERLIKVQNLVNAIYAADPTDAVVVMGVILVGAVLILGQLG